MNRLYAYVEKGTNRELNKIAKENDTDKSKFLTLIIDKIISEPIYYEYIKAKYSRLMRVDKVYLYTQDDYKKTIINIRFPNEKILKFNAIAKNNEMKDTELFKEIINMVVDMPNIYQKFKSGLQYSDEEYDRIINEIKDLEEMKKVKFR